MKVSISPSQMKAGRALIGWSQQDLAREAAVGPSTVADFERGQRTPMANNLQAMTLALETAGISFLPGGAVVGPLPPPFARNVDGTPIQWIDATDLDGWADRRYSQESLPMLMSRLIWADTGYTAKLSFPSGDSVQHPGRDGWCSSNQSSLFVPSGESVWELSARRTNILQKAQEDYDKRTHGPQGLELSNATFIFVTPRRWKGKDKWVGDRRAEKIWGNVLAYDGDDLVHWIEINLPVGLWLAEKIKKRPSGIRQLDDVWGEWSLATKWPLSTDLVLAGRDEEATGLRQWLLRDPAIYTLQADSESEAIAFLRAAISQFPEKYCDYYLHRCVVASHIETARQLADSVLPLIIVLTSALSEIAPRLVKCGHQVFIACEKDVPAGTKCLPRPNRQTMIHELVEMGLETPVAEKLARDCARSLSVLRRLPEIAAIRSLPEWAEQTRDRTLIVAMLVGGWDESSKHDQAVVERLSEQPYSKFIESASYWLNAPDSPICKAGEIWKIKSPRDAWLVLAKNITALDIERLSKAAIEVLGAIDRRFALDPEKRWLYSPAEGESEYSSTIRAGISETLILMALFSSSITMTSTAANVIPSIIKELLMDATPAQWWSLSRELSFLAEAAPDAFLSAVEQDLEKSPTALLVLFAEDSGFGSREYLSGLLWALESLAWSTLHLGRVVKLLCKLTEIDLGESRYSNRPTNSLSQIFLLWYPQTNATLIERMRVLDRIRATHPNVAWNLMIKTYPSEYGFASPSAQPRWRDFTAETPEEITNILLYKGGIELATRLLIDAGMDASRWDQLLHIISRIDIEIRAQIFLKLKNISAEIKDHNERSKFHASLRKILNLHRSFPDAPWTMQETELVEIDALYDLFEPVGVIDKAAWLFSHGGTQLSQPTSLEWGADDPAVQPLRSESIRRVIENGGVEGIFALTTKIDRPYDLGATLAKSCHDATILKDIYIRALKSPKPNEVALGSSIVSHLFFSGGEEWGNSALMHARAENWDVDPIVNLLSALPRKSWAWEQAASFGPLVEEKYWATIADGLYNPGEASDVEHALRKLLSIGRAWSALAFANSSLSKNISPVLLVEILQTAANESPRNSDELNSPTMFQYYVEQILQHLDSERKIPEEEIARLEWLYLPLLQHSRRPPFVLHKIMAQSPDLFVQVICTVFGPSPESGIEESPPENIERASATASRAFNLLESCRQIPGFSEGHFNIKALETWVTEVRRACGERGRGDIGDRKIGELFSSAPADEEGIWPAIPIRNVLENFPSQNIQIGVARGIINRRGVTVRGLTEGGLQERTLARQYREFSSRTALEWPTTSAVLARIAQDYESDATRCDERSEQIQL